MLCVETAIPGVGVGVFVALGLGVLVAVGLGVLVAVGFGVFVDVGFLVFVGLGVFVAVGLVYPDCLMYKAQVLFPSLNVTFPFRGLLLVFFATTTGNVVEYWLFDPLLTQSRLSVIPAFVEAP